ncbi:hypothetical protein ANN_00414 [Periplaneta americana]|uniref:Uncharacterized protein n=1 Tax=Periplaneta americana TaxID=6978 RepID=A0ABQ8TQS7_PERAM|nr:hypothetical protein ANN_00414 [Periplaneta americana]
MAGLCESGNEPSGFLKAIYLYGAETWALRRSEEKRLEAFEMWMWRRMERVKWTDRQCLQLDEKPMFTHQGVYRMPCIATVTGGVLSVDSAADSEGWRANHDVTTE